MDDLSHDERMLAMGILGAEIDRVTAIEEEAAWHYLAELRRRRDKLTGWSDCSDLLPVWAVFVLVAVLMVLLWCYPGGSW